MRSIVKPGLAILAASLVSCTTGSSSTSQTQAAAHAEACKALFSRPVDQP